jgi:hypothetical protein
MTTIREDIIASIKSKLDAGGNIGGAVFRSRSATQARDDGIIIIVEPVMDQATQNVIPKLDWRLTVAITVIARGAIPDQAADPVVAEVHKRVMSDLGLGGLCHDIQPQSSSFEFVSADKDAMVVTNTFDVLYRTSLNDISVS